MPLSGGVGGTWQCCACVSPCGCMCGQLVGAAFGAAGQRCMALSTAVWVGEAREWIPEMMERAKKLKVNAG